MVVKKNTNTSELEKAKIDIKNGSMLSHFLFFLSLPINIIKMKFLNFKKTSELVNFVFNNKKISPMQVKSEITNLVNLVKKSKPKVMMEIGTARGGTLFLFSKVIPKNSFIISLDLPKGKFGGGYPLWKIPLYKSFTDKQTINLVRSNSHNELTLKKIKNILGGKQLDFLFIDGDHTYNGVKKDFELYKQLVKEGGIIAFHDIVPQNGKCKVSEFWKEIKKRYDHIEFVEDWKQNWAGIGVIEND